MKTSSPIAWFEIVTQDLARAIQFYEAAFDIKFDIKLAQCNTPHMQMALFPYAEGYPSGALVYSECYADHQAGPGTTIIYLNTDSVSAQLQKIISLGGEVAFPAISIGEDGHIAGFKDTEGNFVGIWSMNP